MTEFSVTIKLARMHLIMFVVEHRTNCNILDDLGILHDMWCLGKAM